MKIQLKIRSKHWVADGDGVALTILKDKRETLVSLTATSIEPNGDLRSVRWVEGLRLKANEQVTVGLVADAVPSTPPLKTEVETARERAAQKRKYLARETRKPDPKK